MQEKVKYLENQKDQMIDNFKLSSSVLLERLKDLEQFKQQMEQMKHLGEQMNPLERPQTANVLNNICKFHLFDSFRLSRIPTDWAFRQKSLHRGKQRALFHGVLAWLWRAWLHQKR